MTTIFLVFASILVFFVGLFSPTRADKIKRDSDKAAARLNKSSDRFWNPVTFFAQSAITFVNRVINFSAGLGQKSRKKISRKPKRK